MEATHIRFKPQQDMERTMSKIKCLLQPTIQPCAISAAILVLRLVVGAAFILHGWGKIQNPFAWMGEDSTVPAIFQFLAALSEFGGGLALIIGLLTRLACLGLASTMVVAVHLHMLTLGDPFVATKGGASYELALVYLSISILLFFIGAGKLSLDAKLFGQKESSGCE